MRKTSFIACVAGKSGGHIIPCLSIAQQQYAHHQLLFFSSSTALDYQLLGKNNNVQMHIPLALAQLPGKNPWHGILFLYRLGSAFLHALFYFLRMRPQRLITTGGIVAIPVCLAAWILRIPIDLYELNAVPGKATRFLAPFATHLYVCFAATRTCFSAYTAHLVSYPHKKPSHTPPVFTQFNVQKKVVLILGGSQGSTSLNSIVLQAFASIVDAPATFHIIHQAGTATAQAELAAAYKKAQIEAHVFTFEENLAPYYEHAAIIICRAGAGTLWEAIRSKATIIMIPLALADGHQKHNADAMAHEHPTRCLVFDQQELKQSVQPLAEALIRLK